MDQAIQEFKAKRQYSQGMALNINILYQWSKDHLKQYPEALEGKLANKRLVRKIVVS